MDFAETRKRLERKMQENGTDEINFGSVSVFKDITGHLLIQTEKESFSMDRVPADVFDKLSEAIKTYDSISINGIQMEIFPRR